MKRILTLILSLSLTAGPLVAQTAMDKAAEQGRAIAGELLLLPGSPILTGERIGEVVTPYRTDDPPETAITSPTIEDEAERRAAGSTMEGQANQAVVQSADRNPRPGMTASDPAIRKADQFEARSETAAGALFSATGSDNPVCTVKGIAHAGKVERSCQRMISIDEYMCRKQLKVTVEQDTIYQCEIRRTASGAILSNTCTAAAGHPACTEDSAACLNLVDGKCLSTRKTYICTNVSGELGGAVETATSSPRISERMVETCDPGVAGGSCSRDEETCTSGVSTRVINGVPVTRDCWAWDQPVACKAEGLNTDCTVLANDPACTRIREECIVETEDGGCLQYEDRYRCEGTPGQETDTASCKKMTVCAGGYCEEVTPEPANTDFGGSAAWLGVLDEMSKDAEKSLDTQELRVFNGTRQACRVQTTGVLNCCKDSGWGNGIIGQCNEEEFALMDRMDAEAVHYIGTYCSIRALICLEKKRVYCAFNSKLARIFVEQYRMIEDQSWGTPRPQYKLVAVPCETGTGCGEHGHGYYYESVEIEGTGPQCQGITLEEMEAADMERIDLSEAFSDFIEAVNVPAMTTIRNILTSRLGGN